MATTPTLISIEEYLETEYTPDADYIDGEVEERELGEYEHGKMQDLIQFVFTANERDWRTDTVPEQRIRITSSRVRVCDIAILREDVPKERVTEIPPLVCIEIFSRKDRLSHAKLVLADYFAIGVANIWIIDPLKRAVYTFGAQGLQSSPDFILSVAGTPIRVDVNDLFARLDRKLASGNRL